MNPSTRSLIAVADNLLKDNTERYSFQFSYQGQQYWLKRRPLNKKKIWHSLQTFAAKVLGSAVLTATVVDKNNSLKEEAKRLHYFTQQQIAVPTVIHATDSYLITTDAGQTLHSVLAYAPLDTKKKLLAQAIDALSEIHSKKLCHGRPSSRDMLIGAGALFFIDLEENPLTVMSLAEAQARDLWLFLNNASRYYPENPELLSELFLRYQSAADPETLDALKKMVRILAPFRRLIERYFSTWIGRDVRCAIAANRCLEVLIT